jgi:putative transposase
VLRDKAEAAGITVHLVDERGTSSTCPSCSRRVPRPAGRVFSCPYCGLGGHRDLVAAASIAARNPGGGTSIPAIPSGAGITHRRTGKHRPGVHPARRDPRRRPSSRPPPWGTWPAPARPQRRHRAAPGESLAATRGVHNPPGVPDEPTDTCTRLAWSTSHARKALPDRDQPANRAGPRVD